MVGDVLYGNRGAGSTAVDSVLVEAGSPDRFRAANRTAEKLPGEAHTRIDPRQKVPAPVTPQRAIATEVPAIQSHLADSHPQSTLATPAGSPARAQADLWLAVLQANLREAIPRIRHPAHCTTDRDCGAGGKAAAEDYVARDFAICGPAIGEAPFFAGAALSGEDFFAWMPASWAGRAPLARDCPRLAEGVARNAG